METKDVEFKVVDPKLKKIKLSERTTVYATGKGKGEFLKAGKPIKVHPVLAEKFIEKGLATKKAPKE